MKIDFLVGENRYSTTSHFAKAFSKALERQGVQTRLHWIGEGYFFHAHYTILQDPPDFTCSFSDVHLAGRSIGELWKIPHLSLLVDPAIYFLHQMRGEYSWVSCVDQGDVEFVHNLGFKRVFYLAHAADPVHQTSPYIKRPFDSVFFGSCAPQESQDGIVKEASRRVLQERDLSIFQSLVDLGVPDEELPGYHMQVDLHVRFIERIEILCALKGHNIHIWGVGPWEKYVPHATIHPPISFDQTLEVMKQAKVVVNSSSRFKKGLHERIVYGAMCGARVLSTQDEIDECFIESSKEHAFEMQKNILNHHTWDHRATLLIDQLL